MLSKVGSQESHNFSNCIHSFAVVTIETIKTVAAIGNKPKLTTIMIVFVYAVELKAVASVAIEKLDSK